MRLDVASLRRRPEILMTTWNTLAAVGAVVTLLLFGLARSQPPTATIAGHVPVPEKKVSYQEVAETAQAFDAAYNAHDADAVTQLFSENAELADEGGMIQGRAAIRDAFAEVF